MEVREIGELCFIIERYMNDLLWYKFTFFEFEHAKVSKTVSSVHGLSRV